MNEEAVARVESRRQRIKKYVIFVGTTCFGVFSEAAIRM